MLLDQAGDPWMSEVLVAFPTNGEVAIGVAAREDFDELLFEEANIE